ncbi:MULTISPECIES: DUF4232 domain-containing protein [Streptomyces]|uniref:DUF4232 domain-containing protein n=2 Tax=Streptomyces rimosus subsp. rimosus TaxID=132474 RepID=L8EYZ0_STRR1|nr:MULTISPECIES: DUF4232 domain-containing protein [Streptomyces]KOG71071.1 hypothetical protein ADK78_26120 [Kitasatospora aureofaciens]MYT45782.1 DUF4232 domain-containing protein [Streptomyces sp. SID5471]KEF02917.1 hypothetical protein DF17_31010 [Streptomyces rimosus]KEF18550.1 hypothetical protein DF18_21605 [Streptomyces rimosus]KOT33514.1 hypothetical protein ADK84_25610 [Streptomyces sp. NRRL WC-3701]
MPSRLFTTRTARIAASAAAVAAAFSLTACGGGEDGKKAVGAARPAASAGPDASAPSAGADGSGGTGPSAKSPSGAGSPSGHGSHATSAKAGAGGKRGAATGGKSTACTAANTKVTVSKLSRPINHLLLTLTNTGSTRCDAYHYPALRFDDAQAPTAVREDSKPQAVVSVEPGKSAYAAVRTSDPTGEAEGGKTVRRLEVFFANRDGGYYDRSTRPALPKDTYIDDSAQVTYWQSELDDAL